MGQEITVTTRPGASPAVRMFTVQPLDHGHGDRALRLRGRSPRSRAPDVLAHRLFDLGATAVTVYSSDVIVEAPPEQWAKLEPEVVETIENLFGFYGDDAGWSDESLRAIGVEPLPRPEPTE